MPKETLEIKRKIHAEGKRILSDQERKPTGKSKQSAMAERIRAKTAKQKMRTIHLINKEY